MVGWVDYLHGLVIDRFRFNPVQLPHSERRLVEATRSIDITGEHQQRRKERVERPIRRRGPPAGAMSACPYHNSPVLSSARKLCTAGMLARHISRQSLSPNKSRSEER